MKTGAFAAIDEAATQRLGAALAGLLPLPATVALSGPLGAGKTRLVQAIAEAWGIPREDVISPTFVLCREHHGRRTVYHLDAYRIRDDDEFRELGASELFAAPAVTFVEWAERVVDCLPEERLDIRIVPMGEASRDFHFTAYGARFEELLDRLHLLCAGL